MRSSPEAAILEADESFGSLDGLDRFTPASSRSADPRTDQSGERKSHSDVDPIRAGFPHPPSADPRAGQSAVAHMVTSVDDHMVASADKAVTSSDEEYVYEDEEEEDAVENPPVDQFLVNAKSDPDGGSEQTTIAIVASGDSGASDGRILQQEVRGVK